MNMNLKKGTIANVFCFGAFTEKMMGVVYKDCTGNFPFMSLDGNFCFLVMYHYETNAIFAVPIPGLDSKSILDAYKKIFKYLMSKRYCLVWATKLLLAAIGLVFPALGLGYKSFNCSMYHVPVPTLIEKFV